MRPHFPELLRFTLQALLLRQRIMKKSILVLATLGLVSCARPVTPEGGPKDNTPPQLVQEKSTPSLSTRFTDREFKLSFDEWVTLQDVGTQVLVSPPLAKRPEVTLKGRTVTFKFDKDEVLRPNTTYTVNFGTAVKDLHEGNPAKDLRFVFSTGDVIDSLSVSGVIVDGFTGEAVENISILLYDNFEDSIVRKERPYYVARSDKSGQYSIPNVRAGAFKIVAIDDVTPNLKWDDNERIGFSDTLIQVSDSLRNLPPIRVFTAVPALRLLSQQTNQYGLIKLGYNASPDTIALLPDAPPGLRWLREQQLDTLLIWYDLPDSTDWKLVAGKDTIAIRALSRTDFLENNLVAFADEQRKSSVKNKGNRQSAPTKPAGASAAAPPRTVTVRLNKPVQIEFNQPLTRVDTARCLLLADSLEFSGFDIRTDSSNQRAVLLDIAWESGQTYTLTLLPGAVTDFFGTSNADTLRRIFVAPEEKQLGRLNLNLEPLQVGENYILRLLNGNIIEEERIFSADSTSARFVFQKLQPLPYSAQLIEDRNGNRRWDPGDYFEHRQPELVFIKKLEPLRANWEVEATLLTQKRIGKKGG